MRPSSELLDLFYGLAELDTTVRLKAVAKFDQTTRKLAEADENGQSLVKYCVDRLIGGLGSSRAAARVGYCAALTLLLDQYSEDYPFETLYKIAQEKIDMKNKDNAAGNGIGHHLLATCILSSGRYVESYGLLVDKELAVYRNFPFLAMTVAHTIVHVSLAIDTKTFKSVILPKIKGYLDSCLSGASPEFLFIALQIYKKHYAALSDILPFIKKDGKVVFDKDNLSSLLGALKKIDRCAAEPMIVALINIAREANQFQQIYQGVLEKWATNGAESKVLIRLFNVAEWSLRDGDPVKDIPIVISEILCKRIRNVTKGKQEPHIRVLRTKVIEFCTFLEQLLEDIKAQAQLTKLLEVFESAAGGNFDELTNGHVVSKIVQRLESDQAVAWVKKLELKSVRRLGPVFSAWPIETKASVLSEVLKTHGQTPDAFATVGNCLDSLFYVQVRAGERAVVVLSEENEAALRTVVAAINPKTKKILSTFSNDALKRPLSILWIFTVIWKHLAPTDEKSFYTDNLAEIEAIAKADGEENNLVFIDLLISLLSKPHKFHRSVVHFAFSSLLPNISKKEVEHIVEALSMKDNEMTEEGSSDLDDDDMEVDDDLEAGNSGTSDLDEDDGEDESSEGEGEVDPLLVSKLKAALGDAAANEEDSDEDINLSDVDEDEMKAMDERLTAAFKAMSSKSETKKNEQAVREFRTRIMDLLLFIVSSTSTPQIAKLNLIVPLLSLSYTELKRDPNGPCFKKMLELLQCITRIKKVTVEGKKVKKILNKLVSEAANYTNPVISASVSSIASFLFSLGINEGSVDETVKSAFVELFNDFMKQEEGSISSELATAAIYKYPSHFAPDLKNFIKTAFDEEFRIYRRTEAMLVVASLLTKAVCAEHPLTKSEAKSLASSVVAYCKVSMEKPEEVKPRFFAAVLKTVYNASQVANDEVQIVLAKKLSPVLGELSDEILKSMKCQKFCHQMCGRSATHTVAAIRKALEVDAE